MAKKKNISWAKRIDGVLDIVAKARKKQVFDCSHTADGKKLKVGLTVFTIKDLSAKWTISEVKNEITLHKKIVTLKKEKEFISEHPTKLFVSQIKAINNSIKNEELVKTIIENNFKESIEKLDFLYDMKRSINLKKRLSVKRR